MTRSRISLLVALGVSSRPGRAARTPRPRSGAASSPNTWAAVDGREITRDEVEKAFRRAAAAQQQRSEEEALAAKLQLLNEMIVEEMLVDKARELKIEVSDTEIDNAYAEAKKNITDDQFQKELASREPDARRHARQPAPRHAGQQGLRTRSHLEDHRHRR